MNWLKTCLTSTQIPQGAKELIELVSTVDNPKSFPPSKEYSTYSETVAAKLRNIGSESEARQFVIDSYVLSLNVSVPPDVVYYPPLKEYVRQYYKNPELLVVLFDFSASVCETDGAEEWLRQAYSLDSDNEYVLWQLILGRGAPHFPRDLEHTADVFEDEKWVIGRLLKRNPNDPLALAVRSRLNDTRKPLTSAENIGFLNSIRRLAPHPMKQIGMPSLLDPRRLALPSIKGVFVEKTASS